MSKSSKTSICSFALAWCSKKKNSHNFQQKRFLKNQPQGKKNQTLEKVHKKQSPRPHKMASDPSPPAPPQMPHRSVLTTHHRRVPPPSQSCGNGNVSIFQTETLKIFMFETFFFFHFCNFVRVGSIDLMQ